MHFMHRNFLLMALKEAELGRGCTAPNPSVGAVLAVNDKVLYKAYHKGAGTPHAESLIFSALNHKQALHDATLYVTLEPCNHWGKTPPCTDLIIKSGIKNVVFGYKDPNPIVKNNNSVNILQSHGIKVMHCPEPEIDEFYKSYSHWINTGKPWITAKFAISLDGKITPTINTTYQLTSEGCAKFTHMNRLRSDAILTSSKTVLIDDPKLNVRYFPDNCGRIVAILDKNSKLTGQEQVFKTSRSVIIYNNTTDLQGVMADLGQKGMHDVWVEVGPTLFNALHKLKLVKRTYLYIAPVILGKNAVNAFLDDKFMDPPHKITWQAMGRDNICCIDWIG